MQDKTIRKYSKKTPNYLAIEWNMLVYVEAGAIFFNSREGLIGGNEIIYRNMETFGLFLLIWLLIMVEGFGDEDWRTIFDTNIGISRADCWTYLQPICYVLAVFYSFTHSTWPTCDNL